MLLTLLVACAPPIAGTWLFTKEVTLPTGDECTDDVIHNFVGAYEPIEAGDDPSWTETETGEQSAEVLFARIEETLDGAVLVIGTEALPGALQDDGSWLFYWTGASTGADGLDHVTGYAFDHSYESTSTLRVQGSFSKGTFTGSFESETSTIAAWSESDTWSEEAATIVGGTGNLPASTYLLRIDTGGAESAAANTQLEYDCGETGCTLTVSAACAYRYVLTGVATDFTPDDSRWVEDAGQAAGD
ncbi:MAG: hypothetical protein Q8P18_09340 [Pseudomonadota bacterium]|nr:hypothetical protein [Pseudomonadota bacterium]